jgi:NMD protein affecting ribosome stability and mRNA decay
MMRGRLGRKDRLLKQKRNDVYLTGSKISESSLCSKCGVVFINGRWTWSDKAVNINAIEKHGVRVHVHASLLCPACRRITDNYPAGVIELQGIFFDEHRVEILNLVSNLEAQEKKMHPLERIISVTQLKKKTTITTTGIHLARRIGESLYHSYKGDFSFRYAEADKSIRVIWQR